MTIEHARQLPSGRRLLAALCLVHALVNLGYFLQIAQTQDLSMHFSPDQRETFWYWFDPLGSAFVACGAWVLLIRGHSLRRVGWTLLALVLVRFARSISYAVFSWPTKDSLVFGQIINPQAHPILTLITHCQPSWGWLLMSILCLLARNEQKDLNWRFVAVAPAVNALLHDLLIGGPSVFVQFGGWYGSWYAVESCALALFVLMILLRPRWAGWPLGVVIIAVGFQQALGIWFRWSAPGNRGLYWLTSISLWPAWRMGPYLVIAWFMWRHGTPSLPDDGSPFPRRYCAKCFYNLHGLAGEQCPECGASLQSSDQSVVLDPSACGVTIE